ncbi:DUF5808 domain-containing protein [Alicyclobacillus fodiniaquatilis]|uniref:DUF5808 domain-containing protein n=1 Tax=Alicyclobacillus fodiniaquatilis TaxID=1661150 RepID=A0ABW4JHI3_9BACL
MSNKDPNKGWFFRWIYFNPADKRIIVPRRSGIGITVNFGSIVGMFIALVVLVLIVMIIIDKHSS